MCCDMMFVMRCATATKKTRGFEVYYAVSLCSDVEAINMLVAIAYLNNYMLWVAVAH
jgi:hypothetical protein